MKLRRMVIGFGVAVTCLFGLAMPAVAANPVTVVWQVNLTLPVINRAVLGVVTTDIDNATGQGTWSFQGTVDGKLATSAGKLTVNGSGSSGTVSLVSVDSWNMPGVPRPSHSMSASFYSVGNLTFVTYSGDYVKLAAAPIAVSSPITFPLQSTTYIVSMAGSGSQTVGVLPMTGARDQTTQSNVFPTIMRATVLGGLLTIMVGGAVLALLFDRHRTAASGGIKSNDDSPAHA